MRTEVETQALEVDQRIRDETLSVRAMHPDVRDLSPLLALLGTDDLRDGAIEYYGSVWAREYEVGGRIEVVRQTTKVLSEGVVEVRTCERDWLNVVEVNGELSDFRGGQGYTRGVSRTYRKDEQGQWVNVGLADDRDICRDEIDT